MHTVAEAFTAGLVIDPQYGQSGALQHIQQVFVVVFSAVEVFTSQV